MHIFNLSFAICVMAHGAFVHGTFGSTYINVSWTATNWTNASSICFLALPSLTFNGEDILVDDVISDVMINNSWLGYFRYGYTLRYKGCLDVTNRVTNITTLTVASCAEHCDVRYPDWYFIGLRNTSCYCFGNPPIFGNLACDQRCPTEDFTCGSTDFKRASVYSWKTSQSFPSDDHENHQCLAVVGGQRHWRPCSELHRLSCHTWDTGVETGDWTTYQDRCPRSFGDKDSWTDTVRSWSTLIHNHTETARVPEYTRIQFGYVVQRHNQTNMEFASGSMEKKYTCQFKNDDIVDPITSIKPSTATYNESETNTDNEVNTNTSTNATNHEKGLDRDGNKTLTASDWLLVGLCVALFVSLAFNCVYLMQKIRIRATKQSEHSRPGDGQMVPCSEPEVTPYNRVTPIYNEYLHAVTAKDDYETVM